MTGTYDIDNIICSCQNGETIDEANFVSLMMNLMDILYLESNVLELPSPTIICGDVHGQLYDVFQLFDAAGSPKENRFLFMGDYVDRGNQSILTFAYLAALKLKYPENIYLLRGNHESRQVNAMYGLYSESFSTYGHYGIWNLCNEVFDLLPMAAVVSNEVFAVHGGLSPQLPLIEKINTVNRFEELPSNGPFCDLTWSDPSEDETRWSINSRGAGYIFGKKQVDAFCHLNNISFITRSHQLAMEGFQWFFDQKLITVWSAPNYMYRSGNKASVMRYNTDNAPEKYEIIFFQEMPKEKRKEPEEVVQTGYFS